MCVRCRKRTTEIQLQMLNYAVGDICYLEWGYISVNWVFVHSALFAFPYKNGHVIFQPFPIKWIPHTLPCPLYTHMTTQACWMTYLHGLFPYSEGITILFISLIPNSAFFFLLPPLNVMTFSPLEIRSRTFASIVSSGASALASSVSNVSNSSGKYLRCSVFMHSIPIGAGGSSTCFKHYMATSPKPHSNQ